MPGLKNKTQLRTEDEVLLLIIGGQPRDVFEELHKTGKSDKMDFLIQLRNLSKTTLTFSVTDVVLDKDLEFAYHCKATCAALPGKLHIYYDSIKHRGWVAKQFDNRLN